MAFCIARLLQSSVDETVFGIHDGRLGVFLSVVLYAFCLGIACVDYLLGIGQTGYHSLRLAVFLQQFYGEIACGILVSYLFVLLYLRLYCSDALLNELSVIHVYVSVHAVLWLWTMGKIFLVLLRHVFGVVLVPVLQVFGHFRVDVAILVEIVNALIHIDDDVEKQVDTLACAEHSGHHGHAEQLSEFAVVEFVAALFELVEHIECANHAQVHVDQLGGEIQVALDVARIHHVYHHVGSFFYYLLAHIKLFGTVGRQRVCAGQIDDVELVALKRGVSLLCVHCHTGVVAYTFMRSRSHVKQRCLAAVGVAHESHVDSAPLLHCRFAQLLVGEGTLISITAVYHFGVLNVMVTARVRVSGLFFRDYLNHCGLVVAQRHLISHHLVLHGVLQGSVEKHLHGLPLYKSHFDNAFAEAAMAKHLDNDSALACLQL